MQHETRIIGERLETVCRRPESDGQLYRDSRSCTKHKSWQVQHDILETSHGVSFKFSLKVNLLEYFSCERQFRFALGYIDCTLEAFSQN